MSKKQLFQHYKGDIYEFVCYALMEKTTEEVVVYRPAKKGIAQLNYVRPVREFFAKFKKIEEAEASDD